MDIVKNVKEALPVVITTTILSTIGGFFLESIKTKLLVYLPLLVLIPPLNDMIGDFTTIIASKFTTYLYLGTTEKLKSSFKNIIIAAFVASSFLIGTEALLGLTLSISHLIKALIAVFLSCVCALSVITVFSVYFGNLVYQKGHDPDNYLNPIGTGFADLISMFLFALFVNLLF